MAQASRTAVLAVPSEKLLKVIQDFKKYPEFVTGVKSAEILQEGGGSKPARVKYGVEIMGKKIDYTLDHFTDGASGVRWELVESSLMKVNRGGWKLEPKGGASTEVTYTLELELNFSVPGFIMNQLVKSSLPTMMESFEKRAKTHG